MNINKLINEIQFEKYNHINSKSEWTNISKQKLDPKIINKFGKNLNWQYLLKYNKIPEKLLYKFIDEIIYQRYFHYGVEEIEKRMKFLIKNSNPSEQFFIDNIGHFSAAHADFTFKYKQFSEQTLKLLYDQHKIDITDEYILKYQKFSEQFIEQYFNKFSMMNYKWTYLSQNKNIQFTPEFLLKYKNRLNWNYLTRYQNCIFEEEHYTKFSKYIKLDKIRLRKSLPDTAPSSLKTYIKY